MKPTMPVTLPLAVLIATLAVPALAAAPGPVPKIEGPNYSGAWEDPDPPEVQHPSGLPPR